MPGPEPSLPNLVNESVRGLLGKAHILHLNAVALNGSLSPELPGAQVHSSPLNCAKQHPVACPCANTQDHLRVLTNNSLKSFLTPKPSDTPFIASRSSYYDDSVALT